MVSLESVGVGGNVQKLPDKFLDELVKRLDSLDWNITQYQDRTCSSCNHRVWGRNHEYLFCPMCSNRLPLPKPDLFGRDVLEKCIIDSLEECGAKL